MIKCKNFGKSYNVSFSQCPLWGTLNSVLHKPSPSFAQFDKISLEGRDIEKISQGPDNEVTTVVSFHVPFLLHLHNGTYEMKYGSKWIVFEVQRFNEPSELVQKILGVKMIFPKNAEIPDDRFGRLAHSHIAVFIPYRILDDIDTSVYQCPKCGTELVSTPTVCSSCGATFTQKEAEKPTHSIIKITAIKYFNRFLEAYRFYSQEYYIEPVKNTDVISFQCDYVIKGRTYSGYKYFVDTGSGGIKGGDACILSDDTHNNLRNFLKQGSPIEIQERLLGNSKNHLLTQEYPLAIIEAVSALEIVLSDFIRTECKMADIDDKKIEQFIRDVGVMGQVKVVLKVLTKNKPQLDDPTFLECESAITLRNSVVHRGLLELDPKDVKKKIVSIERMLRYVQSIQSKQACL